MGHHATRPALSTLSLHDALPISHSPPTIADPSDAYEFWYINDYEDGEPIPARWSSCEPIRYQINPESGEDRTSTRLNSSHVASSYAGFCLRNKRIVQATVHDVIR